MYKYDAGTPLFPHALLSQRQPSASAPSCHCLFALTTPPAQIAPYPSPTLPILTLFPALAISPSVFLLQLSPIKSHTSPGLWAWFHDFRLRAGKGLDKKTSKVSKMGSYEMVIPGDPSQPHGFHITLEDFCSLGPHGAVCGWLACPVKTPRNPVMVSHSST